MRLILYLGKGGVGKTTTAAATAARAAELGHRTLVVSTDVAHSLADALDHPLGALPTQLTDRLWGQEINVLDEVRQHWGELRTYLAGLLRRKGVDDVASEELAIIPGMEEVVSLLHIRRQAKEGNFDVVVVDAAPTGETIRLLYGGSLKPANAAEILAIPHVNGGLVGGASLLADDLFAIMSAA